MQELTRLPKSPQNKKPCAVGDRGPSNRILRWSARRNKLLSDTAACLLESNDPQSVVEDLCHKVMAFLDCQVFFNYLVDEGDGVLRLNACAGIPEEEERAIGQLKCGVAVAGCVARDRRRIVASDVQNSDDGRTQQVKSYGVQAYCCHPLMAQGQLIGTLSFGARTRRRFSRNDIEVMETVAGLVAMAMKRVQTEAALRASEHALRASESRLAAEAKTLKRLNETGSRLWRIRDLHDGLKIVLSASIELLGADFGNIQLMNTKRNSLYVAVHQGYSEEFLDLLREVSAESGSVCGRALRRRERHVVEDIESDDDFAPMRSAARAAGFRAAQSTPLIGRDGAPLGMLSTHFRAPHRPTQQDLRWLDLYARKAADFIERCRLDKARRESEGRLRAVMDALPVGVALVDLAGKVVTNNAAFDAIWGQPRPETNSLADYASDRASSLDNGQPLAAEDWASAQVIQRGEAVVGQLLRIRSFDGRTIYVNNGAAPIHDAHGRTTGAAVAMLDISEQVRADEDLRRSQQDLNQAQSVGDIGSWRLDLQRNELSWSDQTYRIFAVPKGTRLNYEFFLSCVHPADRAQVDSEWRAALKGGEPYDVEHRILADGQVKWVRERAVLEFAPDGVLLGGFGVAQDITGRKAREQQIQLLLREVNHRSKNMLALVQAIAWQTAAAEPQDFVERFSERIGALAASQDLLIKSEWTGVEIAALIRSQLAHFGDLIGDRIRLEGPALRLAAQASQSLGMALHELSTNAGKYGALSTAAGKVTISWGLNHSAADAHFSLSWVEREGPEVSAPMRRGFGSTVIVSIPRMELDAHIELDYAPSGLIWRLDCLAARVLDSKWVALAKSEQIS